MEYISSPKNDRIKTAKKLTVKKHQKDAGRYLLEGRHLVQEALASGQTPYDIYATEKYVEDYVSRSEESAWKEWSQGDSNE